MDIQKMITDLVGKLTNDKALQQKFSKDPIGTVKSLLKGVGVTDDQIKAIADGVKAKLNLDKAADLLGGLGGLLGKK